MSNSKDTFQQPHKNASKKTALIVVAVSSSFCILILALLFSISKDEIKQQSRVQSDDVIDLLNSQQDESSSLGINSDELGIELPKGGWVQQTDSQGDLKQQYRCESLDPNPSGLPIGWIEMKQPEVELYLGDNRVVKIKGHFGIANAPKRTLESGEIFGDVKVSMFEINNLENSINPTPLMELRTAKVNFDNFIGEISCPSEVRITSPSHDLVGRKLSIRFNDLEERIEYLRLDELDYIDFTPKKDKNTIHPAKVASNTTSKTVNIQNLTNSTHAVRGSAVGDDIDYFIVTLKDNVQVTQGNQINGKYAKGSALTISFSNKSKSENPSTNYTERYGPMPSPLLNAGMPITLIATTLTAQLNPEEELPVRVTCNGGLTMIPLDNPSLIPTTPTETRIELFDFPDEPAQLFDYSQQIYAYGSLLRYELQANRSDLYGSPARLVMSDMETSSNHLWVSPEDGAGGSEGAGLMKPINTQRTTTLEWSEGVDFSFASSKNNDQGSLESVICNGNVILSEQGSDLFCEKLSVSFAPDANGDSSPKLAVASGGIKATSDAQTLWANKAEVTFSSVNKTIDIDNSMFGGSRADTMSASGDVQVLLSDGGRAFCDKLDGDISQDMASLTGNVVIAYERMLMNKGETASLTLNRNDGKGRWSGAGQALFLESPIDVTGDHRINRPTTSSTTEQEKLSEISMRANWTESMNLDQKFNEGAGAIDISGQVSVRSQRTPQERSQMTGDDLRLEFSDNSSPDAKEVKELHKVIAKQNAQIEHRTWDLLFPDLPPVVYYIGGDHLEFNSFTQEALAVGLGELVIRDPRKADNQVHQSALAGRGTTRFTWDNKLQTTRLKDNTYRLEMTGNVEMVHKGLDGRIGMLTTDKLNAIAIDPTAEDLVVSGSELTLRGMDLQQINANGRVYVATETRRVDCDLFNYNLKTGFAQLEAVNANTIAVVTEGSPYPVRAKSIVWNMDPTVDTISIKGLQGTGTK